MWIASVRRTSDFCRTDSRPGGDVRDAPQSAATSRLSGPRAMEANSSKTAVYAALIGNALVAATKIGAALWTGELGDDERGRPLGRGHCQREPAALRLSPGEPSAGRASSDGVRARIVPLELHRCAASICAWFRHFPLPGRFARMAPRPIQNPLVNYVVLGLSFVFEGVSWSIALRGLRAASQRLGYYESFIRSKNPPAFYGPF